jgi:hypothetical protein
MPKSPLTSPPPRLIPEGHPLDLLGRIKDLPLQPSTVLNLGAGICGSPISEQLHFLPCKRLIHIEKFEPYMSQLRQMPFAAENVEFHEVDIMEFLQSPAMPTADISLMIDVLEHLSREDAEKALEILKRKTRYRILIWLPLGECPIEPIHDNPFQVHLSTWHHDDPQFAGHTVERFERYHEHLDPPADAGWVIINTGKPSGIRRLLGL